jgi:multiple sugar transport system ATP-binding protein
MAEIVYDNVQKQYPDGTHAIRDMSLDIDDGEFVVFVGPSGCGKSTALRMTAGLEEITGGRLLIGDKVVNSLAPQQRDIAMVFQDYALYPHMTVRENMGFALRMMKLPKSEIIRRVDQAAERLSLTALLDKKPKNMSGGQRQRVAMGRAIVREPKAFLMDEPLSNLDAKLRVQMRAEISSLQRQLGVTTIYVTHDQVEAMTMGDRVAVMKAGVLQQVAAPETLYDAPANVFVAGFIGSPKMNLFRTTLTRDGAAATIVFGGSTLTIPRGVVEQRSALAAQPTGEIIVGIRPEAFSVNPDAPPEASVEIEADVVELLGNETLVHFTSPMPIYRDDDGRDLGLSGAGDMPEETEEAERMVARITPARRFGEGSAVRFAVDLERLYFFDTAGKTLS